MSPPRTYHDAASLGEILVRDFDLRVRRGGHEDNFDVHAVNAIVQSAADSRAIVYTAFDGDHQQLSPLMRKFALQRGVVPANPESILGYKETVKARFNKRGVLLDDLAVLRGCDELWVFTDVPCNAEAVRHLAEGVVIELLYFLKRRKVAPVRFVSAEALLRGRSCEPVKYTASYSETVAGLMPSQKHGVLALANSGLRTDKELPSIVYHICDPLDFKYAHWLREECYESRRAPLVPSLAIELDDVQVGLEGLGCILVAWAKLLMLAGSAYKLPSMDMDRSPSRLSALLELMWVQRNTSANLSVRSWSDYTIPKARLGKSWPLTKKEGGIG